MAYTHSNISVQIKYLRYQNVELLDIIPIQLLIMLSKTEIILCHHGSRSLLQLYSRVTCQNHVEVLLLCTKAMNGTFIQIEAFHALPSSLKACMNTASTSFILVNSLNAVILFIQYSTPSDKINLQISLPDTYQLQASTAWMHPLSFK